MLKNVIIWRLRMDSLIINDIIKCRLLIIFRQPVIILLFIINLIITFLSFGKDILSVIIYYAITCYYSICFFKFIYIFFRFQNWFEFSQYFIQFLRLYIIVSIILWSYVNLEFMFVDMLYIYIFKNIFQFFCFYY